MLCQHSQTTPKFSGFKRQPLISISHKPRAGWALWLIWPSFALLGRNCLSICSQLVGRLGASHGLILQQASPHGLVLMEVEDSKRTSRNAQGPCQICYCPIGQSRSHGQAQSQCGMYQRAVSKTTGKRKHEKEGQQCSQSTIATQTPISFGKSCPIFVCFVFNSFTQQVILGKYWDQLTL